MPDGSCLADHFERYRQKTGRDHPDYKPVVIPEIFHYLFEYFVELGRSRPVSMGGWLPLHWSEIAAWQQVRHVSLSNLEMHCLMRLDETWLKAMAKPAQGL